MRNSASHVRDGAASVELAMLLPFIFFLFAAGVDYARIVYFSEVVETCARNGALYLADSQSASNNLYASVSAAALADATNLTPQPSVTSGSGTDANGNAYVTCTVSWQFNTITKFLNTKITRTVQMRTVQ